MEQEADEDANGDEDWVPDEEPPGMPGGGGAGTGLVRTFFVFTKLPRHIEWRVSDMPILPEGTALELDVAVKNPRNPSRSRRIVGLHRVTRAKLVYSTARPGAMGLTQYLEISPEG